jgi:hypothetical protein
VTTRSLAGDLIADGDSERPRPCPEPVQISRSGVFTFRDHQQETTLFRHRSSGLRFHLCPGRSPPQVEEPDGSVHVAKGNQRHRPIDYFGSHRWPTACRQYWSGDVRL